MASSLNTLLLTRADFVNWLCFLTLAVSANISYATASQEEQSAREALEFAAKALQLWEERAPHLSGVEWDGADDILAAAQALWEEWRGADWSMTAPFGCFFVDDLESPSPKVTKRTPGRVSVNKNLSFWTSMDDMAGSHATTRFTVDEGWEGTIGVHLNWTTRAVVKLAPYAERLAYQAAQGAELVKELDAGEADAEGKEENREGREDGVAKRATWYNEEEWEDHGEEAKMATRDAEEEAMEAERAGSEGDAGGEETRDPEAEEEAAKRAERGERKEEAERAEREGVAEEREEREAERARVWHRCTCRCQYATPYLYLQNLHLQHTCT
ncbi:hypothetical protein C0991_004407 [Blastosporella zonata]|nr:hypothetical protein C0991_004407 [Blastosporella zonata]